MATETETSTAPTEQRASQVRVHLKSRTSELELPQETGPILVSTDLRRYQLSTLVNRLLETEKPIPLEFLINGQFLRTSLDQFLTQNGISAETTLQVEYVKALIPPQHITSYEQDDWISGVDVLSPSSQAASWSSADNATTVPSRILSASYDGNLRIWNMSNEVIATGQGHTASVKSAKFLSPSQIVSSGVDRTVRLWKYTDDDSSQATLAPTLELYGHKASVDRLAVHGPSSRVLSASADARIGLWTTKKSDAPAAPESLLPASNKRRKLSGPSTSTPQRGALAFLSGHQQAVTDTCFDARDPTVAYSASHDHAVKTWDLPTARCVDTRPTAQALTALCHLPAHALLAAGGALRYIACVDPRAAATTTVALTLRGHTNTVTALARDPASEHRLVSASNDGTCRIWDLRAARTEAGAERVGDSVFVIDRVPAPGSEGGGAPGKRAPQGDESRVFAVCWDAEVGIVSAGRDKLIQIHKGSVA